MRSCSIAETVLPIARSSGQSRFHILRKYVGRLLYEGSITEREIAICRSPYKFDLFGRQLIFEEIAISRSALAAFLCEQHVEVMRRDQLVQDAISICTITRPSMMPGMVNHLGANGIKFDVSLTGQKVAVVIHNA
jgi:hypothetical protein